MHPIIKYVICYIQHGGAAFPFTAIVGQETMKRALLLNAVNPGIVIASILAETGIFSWLSSFTRPFCKISGLSDVCIL
ncbi:MAG TPA: hypothetical protein PLP90_04615 [Methanoculleus sp.]|nr:hypothetical protein [Methanoculleus sp.]